MRGLRPFGALLKRYAGKIFLKSRFGHPTAKVGLTKRVSDLADVFAFAFPEASEDSGVWASGLPSGGSRPIAATQSGDVFFWIHRKPKRDGAEKFDFRAGTFVFERKNGLRAGELGSIGFVLNNRSLVIVRC